MLYTLKLKIEAYHKPTATWHVHETTHGLRAVSRRNALDKGLKALQSMPGYTDRAEHPDWTVYGEVLLPSLPPVY